MFQFSNETTIKPETWLEYVTVELWMMMQICSKPTCVSSVYQCLSIEMQCNFVVVYTIKKQNILCVTRLSRFRAFSVYYSSKVWNRVIELHKKILKSSESLQHQLVLTGYSNLMGCWNTHIECWSILYFSWVVHVLHICLTDLTYFSKN